MRLIVLSAGTYYHIETLEGPRHASCFDLVLAPEALAGALTPDDCLLVPCRTPPGRMLPLRGVIAAHLAAGGTLVAMGESRSDLWLPCVTFHGRSTNWWWWLEPGAELGVRVTAPDHAVMAGIGPDEIAWHLHGHFDPPDGAEILATDRDGLAILYLDTVSTPGQMLITSLDPIYHHGSHFMPATTRFLDRFLPNLRRWLHG